MLTQNHVQLVAMPYVTFFCFSLMTTVVRAAIYQPSPREAC
jgi:hypothetical protein